MRENETELDMVRRHIARGDEQLTNQRALIVRLRAKGMSTELAEAVLDTFEGIQREHEDHLTRLLAKLI